MSVHALNSNNGADGPDNSESEDWAVECSDDERYGLQNGEWHIPKQEFIKLYETLNERSVLDLGWQCPPRRAQTPDHDETYVNEDESMESKPEEKSDFDFMDDISDAKVLLHRDTDGAPKGSAKKKTTSLDGVISNIRRHRIIEELEKKSGET